MMLFSLQFTVVFFDRRMQGKIQHTSALLANRKPAELRLKASGPLSVFTVF